ncbi:uncharacterized protein LOC128239068 isoform X2 [Mya arenaria]|nr:uncharacterized protein LOC128239068 isoform X2 [Mya arenaria]
MSCPKGEIIRIDMLQVGYKNNTLCSTGENHCNSSESCCSYQDGDLTGQYSINSSYNTYANCSGQQNCTDLHAPWQRIVGQTFSTYVQVNHSCICVSEEVIPMCGGPRKSINASAVSTNIIFDGRKDAVNYDRGCGCIIRNLGNTVVGINFYPVDIRLRSIYKEENISCSSAKLSADFLDSDWTCGDGNEFVFSNDLTDVSDVAKYKILNIDGNVTITLSNLTKDDVLPGMVWWNLKANDTVDIECYEILSEATTLLPTTTSSDITTTSVLPSTSTTLHNVTSNDTSVPPTESTTQPSPVSNTTNTQTTSKMSTTEDVINSTISTFASTPDMSSTIPPTDVSAATLSSITTTKGSTTSESQTPTPYSSSVSDTSTLPSTQSSLSPSNPQTTFTQSTKSTIKVSSEPGSVSSSTPSSIASTISTTPLSETNNTGSTDVNLTTIPEQEKSTSLSSEAVTGLSVGGGLILIIVVCIVIWIHRKGTRKQSYKVEKPVADSKKKNWLELDDSLY